MAGLILALMHSFAAGGMEGERASLDSSTLRPYCYDYCPHSFERPSEQTGGFGVSQVVGQVG